MRIVEDTATHLRMRDRTLWISILCFGMAALQIIFVAIGRDEPSHLLLAVVEVAFGLAFFRATDVTFDKIGRTCGIRRFDVVRVMRARLAFDDIRDIKVEVSPSGDTSEAPSCRLSVVTASAAIPLTISYEPDWARCNGMRDTLLNTVFAADARPPATDPVRDLAVAGRVIEAVALLRTREKLDLTTARMRVEQLRIEARP